jgi:hypothetical protein
MWILERILISQEWDVTGICAVDGVIKQAGEVKYMTAQQLVQLMCNHLLCEQCGYA